MSLASSIGKRFRAEFASRVITVVSGAILTVALARLLDSERYGLLFLALSVVGIVQIFSILGIPKAGARYIAQYKETDPGQIIHIVRFTFLTTISITVVFSLGLYLGRSYIANRIGESELAPFLLIGIGYLIFQILTTLVRGILQGFEAIESRAVIHAIDRVARFPLALGFVLVGYGAIGALMGYFLASVLAGFIGLMYLYFWYYQGLNSDKKEENLYLRITKYAIPLSATQAAKILDKRVDILLIGFFLNPSAVAFYAISRQLVSFIETPMSALGTTLAPTFQAQKAKGNHENAARIYEQAVVHGILVYVSAGVGVIILAEPTIHIIFGREYLGAVPVLQVLAFWIILRTVGSITSDTLDFLGRAKHRAIAFGITALLNVILNVILIPIFGVVGAAVATVITTAGYILVCVYLITIEFDLRTGWLLNKLAGACFVAGIMSVPIYFTGRYITGLPSLLLVILIGLAIWSVLVETLGYLDIQRAIRFTL